MMTSQTRVLGSDSESVIGKQNPIENNVDVSAEQNRYASILAFCSWAGICVMVTTFLIYMGGLLNPHIEPSQMPIYWKMTVHQYLRATHAPTGWSWLKMMNHSEYLNLIGLAFLGIVSVLGYVSLLIDYSRKKDLPYATMVSLEIVVIVLAASGIFRVTGH